MEILLPFKELKHDTNASVVLLLRRRRRRRRRRRKKRRRRRRRRRTMTGSALATSVCSATTTKPAQKKHERSSRELLHHRLATTLKPHRRPSKVTRGQREICVKSNAADELYVPPGGSIVDASGYEMFSSATGDVRSQTVAGGAVVPRSEAGDPFQLLLRQRSSCSGTKWTISSPTRSFLSYSC